MISLALVILAGACKAVIDACLFHYDTSIFKGKLFFNSAESWKFKYRNNDKAQGDRFFLSSTLFVSFTDSFHLFSMLAHMFLIAAIVLYKPITSIKIEWLSILVDFVILKVAHQTVFHVLFTYAFNKRN